MIFSLIVCVAVYLFRLLYAGHRLMGVNCVTSQGWQLHTPKVCLLDPAARTLRTMNIPFHLALRLIYLKKKKYIKSHTKNRMHTQRSQLYLGVVV